MGVRYQGEPWSRRVRLLGAAAAPAPSGPVNYTITQKSVLEHDTTNGTYNAIAKIDATHFVVAYAGDGDDGFVKTFVVNADLSVSEIDSLEHDTAQGTYNSLVLIDATHFMLAYSTSSGYGVIKTFSIDANCDNIAEIDALVHENIGVQNNSLAMLDSTHFAVAYAGYGTDGFLSIFSIDEAYKITKLKSLEHATSYGNYNSLIAIDANHLLLFYRDDLNAGTAKTFGLDGSYNITPIDSEYVWSFGTLTSICALDASHFAGAYSEKSTNDGFVTTLAVDGSYMITVTGTLEHDTSCGLNPSIVAVDATHFMLAYTYTGINGPGRIQTFAIDGLNNITLVDSNDHDMLGVDNALCQLDATHYALAYAGPEIDGFVKIFELD